MTPETSSDSSRALLIAVISVAVAALALGLSALQEIRHWHESRQRVELDIRTIWLARSAQGIRLAIIDVIAFNPSLLGVAINHVRLIAPKHPEVVFDLVRPKRTSEGGWMLDSVSYDATLTVTGELDYPYGFTPMNLLPRQAESRIFGFLPISQPRDVTPDDLKLVARLSSRQRKRLGFLGWRTLLRRARASFDEVEAVWHPEFVSTLDVPSDHIQDK